MREKTARYFPHAKPSKNVRTAKYARYRDTWISSYLAPGNNPNLRLRLDALSAIQEAAELFIIQFFQQANLLALHRKRVPVELRDMQILYHLMDHHNLLTMKPW